MGTDNTKRGAWNCNFCHATNVVPRCGCAASKKAGGLEAKAPVSLDTIELVF